MQNQNHIRESNILKRIISTKWLDAIRRSNGFIAGGAVRSVFCSEPINDFDIFFRSKHDFDSCVALLAESEDSPTFTTTDTAWTHIDQDKDQYQLICAAYAEPEEMVRNFDFSCCMGAWTLETDFVLDDNFLKHCSQRRLVFNTNAGFPICSLWRAQKFIQRGWKLPGIEAIKLGLAIHHLHLNDRRELKRQLMGIDTLFLKDLTDALDKSKEVAYDFDDAIAFIETFREEEE